MKKLLFILFIISASTVFAQDDFQKMQQEWGKNKKELMQIGMALSPADSVKFWPLYDQYEAERQKLGRERVMILDDYADKYSGITDSQADNIIGRMFKNDASLTKLQKKYYSRIKKAVNAREAVKFMHVERYIQASLRAKLLGSLPVIGQLDSIKPK